MITFMNWSYGIESDKGKIEYDMSKEIEKAFLYFYRKYNVWPDICQIHTDSENVEDVLTFDNHKLAVSRHRYVLPKTLLIGCSDETKEIVAA